MAKGKDYQTGIFSVVTHNIFFFMRATCFFILAVLPVLIWLFIFERSVLDVVLFFLGGPAISAIVRFMIAYIETDFTTDDYPDFRDFRTYYKNNFKESLVYWIPYCLLLAVMMTNMQNYQWSSPEIGLVMTVIYGIFIVFLTIMVGYLFILSAKYKFNLQTLIRLSIYYLFTFVKSSLAIVSILILMLVVIFFVNEFFLLLFSGIIAYILVRYAYPIVENAGEYFIKKEQ